MIYYLVLWITVKINYNITAVAAESAFAFTARNICIQRTPNTNISESAVIAMLPISHYIEYTIC